MITVTLEGELFRVRSPYNENLIPILRNIFTAKWNRGVKAWEYRASPGMAYTLAKRLKAWHMVGDSHFNHMLQQYAKQKMMERQSSSAGSIYPSEPGMPKRFAHQEVGLNLIVNREYVYLTWEMGCVDCNTEYLSPNGWARIDEYSGGPVAQWNPFTEEAEFVEPLRYIKTPAKTMLHISGRSGTDQMLSPDHRVPLVNKRTGEYNYTIAAKELRNAKFRHLPCKYTMSFYGSGIPIGDDELRVQIAVMADGHFHSQTKHTKRCYVRLKKKRKKERLVELLEKAKIPYDIMKESAPGFTKYAFSAPLRIKTFPKEWLSLINNQQRDIICSEIVHWDGSKAVGPRGFRYFSRHKSDVDFMQILLASMGHVVAIHKGAHCYNLSLRGTHTDHYVVTPGNIKECKPPDAHQYCFEVPTSFLIFRRSGKVFITGNSAKSRPVVDACGALNLRNVLIVCPKSVIQEWPRQFALWGKSYPIKCIPLEKGTIKKRMKVAHTALSKFATALVINYDAVWRQPFHKWALHREWDLVVADECHRIKGHKSRASKFFAELREYAKKRVALSGTPIPNNPLDLWAQCRFLDPFVFGDSFTGFRSRFGVVQEFTKKARDNNGNFIYDAEGKKIDATKKDGSPDSFRTVVAFRNLEQLNEIFGKISHRVTKDECLDLPEVMDERREVELGKDGAKHYEAMDGAFQAKIDNREITIANALVEGLRLQQCTGGAVQYDDKPNVEIVDTSKQEALQDIIEELETDEPVVVFCRFHPDLDAVHNAAKAAGRESVELSGRRNELGTWRGIDGQPSIIAVQIQSGGLGVNLTRARYCIYYSLGFSLGDYEQSRARVHRQGQTRKVTYYHILSRVNGKATIDHEVYKALKEKKDVVRSIVDGRNTSA